MTLGMMLLCCAVAGLAIDGAKVFIHRRTLQNVADAGARAGASALRIDRYYSSDGRDVVLDERYAVRLARRALAVRGPGLTARVEASMSEVRMEVSGSVQTSFLRLVGIDRVPVRAETVARPIASTP